MRRLFAGLGLILALVLTACSSASPAPTASSGGTGDGVLGRHGMAGLTVTQVIDQLEASESDRSNGPFGSVRPGELVIADDQGEQTVPITDQFYLSIAPYRNQTHECFFHNLASCKGELGGQTMQITVVDSRGTVLIDEQRTAAPNGFVGMWLPKNITGTLTVTQDGDTATTPIGTGEKDPTCLTTLKLA